jgi:hypothetical protein
LYSRALPRVEENCAADDVLLTPDQVAKLNELTPAAGDHHNAQSSHGVMWRFLAAPSSSGGAFSDQFHQAWEGSIPFLGLLVIAPVMGRTVLDHGDALPATISRISGGVARTPSARLKAS